jgi:hypothetical protein
VLRIVASTSRERAGDTASLEDLVEKQVSAQRKEKVLTASDDIDTFRIEKYFKAQVPTGLIDLNKETPA